jgi:thermopsin
VLKYIVFAISAIMIFSIAAGSLQATGQVTHPDVKISDPANTVNPNSNYSGEPAPMGIVDYGIGANGHGFHFNSTSFTGIVNINNLTTHNSSIENCSHNMGIQLNLNFRFNDSGTNYTYWVQNVAILNTSSHQIAFIDNVWNFTSPPYNMHNNTIHGNGTVHSSKSGNLYYFLANKGAFSNFNYKNLELRSVSYNISGYPHIYMEYNDGNGWVTYDAVNFTFAGNVSHNDGFIVNGNKTNSNSLPIDAGLIMGGPGNGYNTKAKSANLTMALKYWNGHNYQAVANSYNHGSDTAEGISNVSIGYVSLNGTPAADITTGNVTLGSLYSSDNLALMNFTTYLKSGCVILNKTVYNFTGGLINLTLIPGNYSLALYTNSDQRIFHNNYSFSAGNYYSFSTKPTYKVTFSETGLPEGTRWSVDVQGNVLHSSTGNITFNIHNGTYNYSTPAISGYSISNGNGSFTVNGTANHFNITFSRVAHNVHKGPVSIQYYKLLITIGIAGLVAIIGFATVRPMKKKK